MRRILSRREAAEPVCEALDCAALDALVWGRIRLQWMCPEALRGGAAPLVSTPSGLS